MVDLRAVSRACQRRRAKGDPFVSPNAPYKKVRAVAFIDAIPKSPTGKILRRVLKE